MFPASLARVGISALVALGLTASSSFVAEASDLQEGLEKLVAEEGFPGALASFHGKDYVAGVGDLATGAPVPRDGQVRIASATKMFTATVVLQLAGEGRLDLDASVETYLPGLVPNGGNITIRQLLQHTSGLPDYTEFALDFLKVQHLYQEPQELLDRAFAQPPLFEPGTSWSYSNTNYILAGLVVQKVTGRPVGEEITKRVIKRAGLRKTYWPGVGEETIRGAHPHGYTSDIDISVMDPSWGWAAGQLVSTPSDVNKFLTALMAGKLLAPAELTQMKAVVEAPGFPPNWQYGLGLMKITLSCGKVAWGHGGDIPGYETRDAITEDGEAITITVTALPAGEEQPVDEILDEALCA
jgi:D-alanyl-D-alanine carboxypeptidase